MLRPNFFLRSQSGGILQRQMSELLSHYVEKWRVCPLFVVLLEFYVKVINMSINIVGYYTLDILCVHEMHALENQSLVISQI